MENSTRQLKVAKELQKDLAEIIRSKGMAAFVETFAAHLMQPPQHYCRERDAGKRVHGHVSAVVYKER